MEIVREVTVTIEVDTNKRTITKRYLSLRTAEVALSAVRRAVNVSDALDQLDATPNDTERGR